MTEIPVKARKVRTGDTVKYDGFAWHVLSVVNLSRETRVHTDRGSLALDKDEPVQVERPEREADMRARLGYDRQAHLAWYAAAYPSMSEYPILPHTEAGTLAAIAAYEKETPEPVRWQCTYCWTEYEALPSDKPPVCPECGPLHGPGAPYAQPRQLAGPLASEPLDWTAHKDGSRWTAFLPDGRMAVVERLADGVSFLPRISAFGKAEEEAVGPVCAGLLDAARWAARAAERDEG